MEQNLLNYFSGDELAANAWLSKYKIKELDSEQTPDDMHWRLASEFAKKETEYQAIERDRILEIGNTDLSEFGKKFKNETFKWRYADLKELYYSYFANFKYIIPQGSVMSGLGNNFTIGSLSNCFVVGQPIDSYAGIMEKDEQLAQLMKRRGGVGIDISTLRPTSAKVNNSAKTSTGAVSFMHRYSNTTNEVAQGGRRGALMISIDCRHPDLAEFIRSKEDKTKITGANISVRLRNDFMEAVKADGDYILRFPCEATITSILPEILPLNELYTLRDSTTESGLVYFKKVKAKELYESIIYHAWLIGDPGSMFVDNHWDYSPDTVYPQFKGVTSNPCGEIFMQMYDACRLLAINYFSLVINPFTENSSFDFVKLYEIAYIQQRLADTLIDLEIEHIDRIIEKIKSSKNPAYLLATELHLWQNIKKTAQASRRTGCGFTALGDTIAALGFAYDSDEAIHLAEGISKIKMQAELDCTIDLAILRGTFKGWDSDKEYFTNEGQCRGANHFYEMIRIQFPEQFERMKEFGRRNVNWNTVAPTGTVSLMAQTTSGIEPIFLPFYTRRKKININDKGGRVDFTDDEGVEWQEFPVIHPKFKDWIVIVIKNHAHTGPGTNTYVTNLGSDQPEEEYLRIIDNLSKEQLQNLFEQSPWYKSTANDIDWHKRLQMQSVVQKYTSHSISSTINLPTNATVEDIDMIYREAYNMKLKGITVYRDGSKYGVLVNNDNIKSKDTIVKRPKSLPADVHGVTVRGIDYIIVIGINEGIPYEVFGYTCNEGDVCPAPGTGFIITKDATGVYSLECPSEVEGIDDNTEFGDILENMSDEQKAVTRLVSALLRYNVDLSYIVEQLDKVDGDVTSFSRAINRVLKKYVKTKTSPKCDECGGTNTIFEEGCTKCLDCGNSKCG